MQSKLCASCNIILVATIGYKYKVDETVYEIWRYRNIYWLYMIALVLADSDNHEQSWWDGIDRKTLFRKSSLQSVSTVCPARHF